LPTFTAQYLHFVTDFTAIRLPHCCTSKTCKTLIKLLILKRKESSSNASQKYNQVF